MNQQMEREFRQQMAIKDMELERERQASRSNSERLQGQVRALLNEVQNTHIYAMMPNTQFGGSSSSSGPAPAAPMRLALTDAATSTTQAIEDKPSDDDTPLMVRPGSLQPRDQDVRHLFKPKHERTKKRNSTFGIEHFDTFEEWNREGIKFLKEQISYRPGITLTKTEFHDLTKPRAIYLIREFDKKHPNWGTEMKDYNSGK
jgi:hypothetical protein